MKLFLCVPFSSKVNDAGNVVADYRLVVETLLSKLRASGHEVYCALEYTGYAIGGDTPPDEEFRHDFAQIVSSEKMIVLLEERLSAGVELELGYAHANDKRFELYQIGQAAWSNMAFAKLTGQDLIPVTDVDQFVSAVIERNC